MFIKIFVFFIVLFFKRFHILLKNLFCLKIIKAKNLLNLIAVFDILFKYRLSISINLNL